MGYDTNNTVLNLGSLYLLMIYRAFCLFLIGCLHLCRDRLTGRSLRLYNSLVR